MNRWNILSKVRWVASIALPPLVWLILAAARPATAPRPWPRAVLDGLSTDALLVDTILVVVGVPLAAVALTARKAPCRADDVDDSRRRCEFGPQRSVRILLLLVLGFVFSAAATGWAVSDSSMEAMRRFGAAHLTLAAAALALAGLGAWCGVGFRHPLDALACSLGVSVVATGAILVGGPSLADAPGPLVSAGLLASPLVTTAAAAGLDVFRTDMLYQVSPLAHVRLDYPAWQVAVGLYLFVALVCFGGVARAVRRPTTGSTD